MIFQCNSHHEESGEAKGKHQENSPKNQVIELVLLVSHKGNSKVLTFHN